MTYLKNYTSGVPIHTTIGRIESLLIRCGVKGITKEYDGGGSVAALTFHLEHEGRDVSVRLPAECDLTHEAMWQDYDKTCKMSKWDSRRKTRGDFKDQAHRTAWKLAQDWIEVEMSRIQIQKKDVLEVFMAYVWDGRQTYYQALKSNGFRAMLPEKVEVNHHQS